MNIQDIKHGMRVVLINKTGSGNQSTTYKRYCNKCGVIGWVNKVVTEENRIYVTPRNVNIEPNGDMGYYFSPDDLIPWSVNAEELYKYIAEMELK
jgi:hypothetical protein